MLIGIHGRARAGKDSIATVIKEAFPFEKYSFAAPIKDACNLIFGWDQRHADGELKEVVDPFWGFSPRHAYQTLGTEWGRRLLRDDLWIRRCEMLNQKGMNLVIPDVRFPNELEFIRKQGGVMIFVRRPATGNEISLNTHASEAGLWHLIKPEDVVIDNDGTPEDLVRKVVTQIFPFIHKEFNAPNV